MLLRSDAVDDRLFMMIARGGRSKPAASTPGGQVGQFRGPDPARQGLGIQNDAY
jgi:hypothetical protein